MTTRSSVLPILMLLAVTVAPSLAQKAPDDVARETEHRTGVAPAWQAGDGDALVDEFLADGITDEEAAQIALMSNAYLQAMFDALGIARADVIEAGLYSNPALDVVLRFPEHERGSNLEVEIGFSIAACGWYPPGNVWQGPVRSNSRCRL